MTRTGHRTPAAVLPVHYSGQAPSACSGSNVPVLYSPQSFSFFVIIGYYRSKQRIVFLLVRVGGAQVQDMALIQVKTLLPDRGKFSNGCKVPLQGPHRFRISGINPQRSIVKRRGPKTDPCGTPLLTAVQSYGTPFTMTLCLLPANQFSIQAATLPWVPRA